ncbi:MAG: hypothetical protein R6V05_11605 [Candidatus Brocadiia bacterium]
MSPEGGLLSRLLDAVVAIRTSRVRRWIPRPLRTLGYHLLPKRRLARKMWQEEYRNTLSAVRTAPLRTSVRLGIIEDLMMKHGRYEAACRELGVPYELVDISGGDWKEAIEACGCDAFLVWPSHVHTVSKMMFDERLRFLTHEMGRIVFPDYQALWLYESKRRIAEWFALNDVPQPETRVFFDRRRAEQFLDGARYPLVFKTDIASSALGVRILRDRRRAARLVRRCFGKGFLARRHDARDRQWGYILLQQYVPNATEWRTARIGDSFFANRKVQQGEFHSGSREVHYVRPPDRLLDFCRQVSEKGPFASINVDVLETEDGRYLANEIHPVWGSAQADMTIVDGRPGRFVYGEGDGKWSFEPGSFCRNVLCNLRVRTLLEKLGSPLPPGEPAASEEGS